MARFICFRSKWYITWYKWLCIQKTIFRRDISLKTKPLQNISYALFIKSITFWLGHRNSLAAVLVCYCQNGYLSTLFNVVKAGCWLKRRTLYKLGQNWTTSNFFSANILWKKTIVLHFCCWFIIPLLQWRLLWGSCKKEKSFFSVSPERNLTWPDQILTQPLPL